MFWVKNAPFFSFLNEVLSVLLSAIKGMTNEIFKGKGRKTAQIKEKQSCF